jgi:hypothetical protein
MEYYQQRLDCGKCYAVQVTLTHIFAHQRRLDAYSRDRSRDRAPQRVSCRGEFARGLPDRVSVVRYLSLRHLISLRDHCALTGG